jgi:membrane-associated protease RseP (regulator of RpoE activity)
MIKKNVGGVDRVLRIVVGVALIAFALFSTSSYAVFGWIGVVPLLTAVVSFCPAYALFGLSTCPTGTKTS